ncbi:GmrSD restriction endonuclease domain-containing protein [Paenibacillus rhizoplanae]|uniref:DUF262 domain-containing protein n=1 Tax=Paenibacillus rhizoplanae TaxID=1917181 RepID=A0ABW5FBU7_9BACL
MAEPLAIRKVIEKITSGEIRIPAFQRGYVWSSEQVSYLLDSIYKGFPIGTILLWRTRERLKVERDLGNYTLPDPRKDYPIDYVLDGQQRLTSLFSVFQTDLTPNQNEEWLDIYFDFTSRDVIQESKFVPLKPQEFDPTRYFPMNCLFDSVKYRKAAEGLDAETIIVIDKLQERFKETLIPIQIMETEDKHHVAIVFERINRFGTQLDTFQLLSAWSWSTDFDLQDEFSQLAEEIEPFGFGDLSFDKDLQLKCCSGVISGDTAPAAIINLKGEEVRNNFTKIKNGIKSSIDFLQKELNIYSLKSMPYPAMIVALTRFFATEKDNGVLYTEKQRRQLVRWFWRSCFSRRYSSGVTDAHKADLRAMDELRKNQDYDIASFDCSVNASFFLSNQFNVNTVNTKTFITMLAHRGPRSFISGAKVDLSKVLKNVSKNEFHHIFPVNYLENTLKLSNKKDINLLANMCFLNNSDNQKIKDKPPSVYKMLIDPINLPTILETGFCPADAFDIDYDRFLEKRAHNLVEYARQIIN